MVKQNLQMKETEPEAESRGKWWKKIEEIPVEWLKNQAKGIILDVDNTLVNWGEDEVSADVQQWLNQVKSVGLQVCLLSNTRNSRLSRCLRFFHFPYVAPAWKPLPFGYWKALRLLNLEKEEVLVIGDQLLTDIFGARLVGFRALWLPPRSSREFILTRLISRKIEQWLSRILRPL